MNQFKPLVFSTIVAVVFVLLTNKSCAQITADSSFNFSVPLSLDSFSSFLI